MSERHKLQQSKLLGVGRGSFARNAVAGAIATLFDFALVGALVKHAGLSPPHATLWGCCLGGILNFSINRMWAFDSANSVRRSALRYGLVSASSALLNSAGVSLLMAISALVYRVPYQIIWWIVRGLVSVFFNFPLQREFVFAHQRAARR